MDFYLKYKKITRFLYKLIRGVWCRGFVKTEPKEFRLGLHWWNHSNIHKSTNCCLTITAVSDGVFPRRQHYFLQIETSIIFLYYAIGIFLFVACDRWLLIIFLLGWIKTLFVLVPLQEFKKSTSQTGSFRSLQWEFTSIFATSYNKVKT